MSVSSALRFRNFLFKGRCQLQTFSRLSCQYHQSTQNEQVSHEKSEDVTDLPDYEVSTAEMKYVERLLPQMTVPDVPNHSLYPTPSGWVPQKESALSLPYFVRRTRNHMLPVYPEVFNSNRHTVIIKKVEGDIWALEGDLRAMLEKVYTSKIIVSQVHEVGRFIRFKGQFVYDIANFLISKGL